MVKLINAMRISDKIESLIEIKTVEKSFIELEFNYIDTSADFKGA